MSHQPLKRALRFRFDWAGHDDVPVAVPPVYVQCTAIHFDTHIATGALLTMGRDNGCAGPRPASLRHADAALPDLEPDPISIQDLGKADIGLFREKRMKLDHRPGQVRLYGLEILDKKDDMRVAHADRARIAENGCIDRAELHIDMVGMHWLFERYLRPVQLGRSHIDGNRQRSGATAGEVGGIRLNDGVTLACFLHDEPGRAACRVPARIDLEPFLVPDFHEDVGVQRSGPAQDAQLLSILAFAVI